MCPIRNGILRRELFSWEMNSSPNTCDMPTVISHATSLLERRWRTCPLQAIRMFSVECGKREKLQGASGCEQCGGKLCPIRIGALGLLLSSTGCIDADYL